MIKREKLTSTEVLDNVVDYLCFKDGIEGAIFVLWNSGATKENLRDLGFTEEDIEKYCV